MPLSTAFLDFPPSRVLIKWPEVGKHLRRPGLSAEDVVPFGQKDSQERDFKRPVLRERASGLPGLQGS